MTAQSNPALGASCAPRPSSRLAVAAASREVIGNLRAPAGDASCDHFSSTHPRAHGTTVFSRAAERLKQLVTSWRHAATPDELGIDPIGLSHPDDHVMHLMLAEASARTGLPAAHYDAATDTMVTYESVSNPNAKVFVMWPTITADDLRYGDTEPPARASRPVIKGEIGRYDGLGYGSMKHFARRIVVPPADDPTNERYKAAQRSALDNITGAMRARAAALPDMPAAETWCDVCAAVRDPACRYHRCPFGVKGAV